MTDDAVRTYVNQQLWDHPDFAEKVNNFDMTIFLLAMSEAGKRTQRNRTSEQQRKSAKASHINRTLEQYQKATRKAAATCRHNKRLREANVVFS